MKSNEQKLRAYFRSWIDNDISVLPEIFSEDVVYTECYGPQYHGLEQLHRWFEDWNRQGRVISWDISRVMECGSTLIAEWYFRCVFGGEESGFDGVTVADFNAGGKIIRLSEYESKAEHIFPYDNAVSEKS